MTSRSIFITSLLATLALGGCVEDATRPTDSGVRVDMHTGDGGTTCTPTASPSPVPRTSRSAMAA